MAGTIGARALQSLLVLAAMSFVIFILMGLMPGDPVDMMIGADPYMTSEDAARMRALYGLDRPLLERYGTWLGSALTGDVGYSRLYAQPVPSVLAPALANTLTLLVSAFVLSIAIALPAGIVAAARPNTALDHWINGLAFAGISVPPFWLALVLIVLFSVILGWFPAAGTPVGDVTFGTRLSHGVLPVLSLTLASVGGHIRYVRAAMLDVVGRDFIRTAYAKGLSERRVLLGHALRSALIPVVTIVGLEFGTLFSGALITETVFATPGMGRLIYDAVMGNDFNLALVALLLATVVTLAGNILADIAYATLDRRISLAGRER